MLTLALSAWERHNIPALPCMLHINSHRTNQVPPKRLHLRCGLVSRLSPSRGPGLYKFVLNGVAASAATLPLGFGATDTHLASSHPPLHSGPALTGSAQPSQEWTGARQAGAGVLQKGAWPWTLARLAQRRRRQVLCVACVQGRSREASRRYRASARTEARWLAGVTHIS